jgi:hypothetical protein
MPTHAGDELAVQYSSVLNSVCAEEEELHSNRRGKAKEISTKVENRKIKLKDIKLKAAGN